MSESFPADVVAAVCRHMDDDHSADAMLICRRLGGQPRATTVRTVGVDTAAMHFSATVDGATTAVRVPFAEPVRERPEIRTAVVELARRAKEQSRP